MAAPVVRSSARMSTMIDRGAALADRGVQLAAKQAFPGLLAILAVIAGCDPAPGGSGMAGTSAPSASATAPAVSSAAEPAPPPPADLDIAGLQKALGCGGAAKSGPCAVLAAMSTCKPWSAEAPSGDGRWIGRGVEIDGKKTTEQFTVLRLRRVSLSEVGAGQLPGRVGLGTIEKEEGSAYSEADRAIRAFERGDVPPKSSPAIARLKEMSQWSEAFVTRTTGGHVYGISQGGLYVCEGSKHELLVVRRASTRAGAGDGLYATVWAATW